MEKVDADHCFVIIIPLTVLLYRGGITFALHLLFFLHCPPISFFTRGTRTKQYANKFSFFENDTIAPI